MKKRKGEELEETRAREGCRDDLDVLVKIVEAAA